jgi:hypothetical protein
MSVQLAPSRIGPAAQCVAFRHGRGLGAEAARSGAAASQESRGGGGLRRPPPRSKCKLGKEGAAKIIRRHAHRLGQKVSWLGTLIAMLWVGLPAPDVEARGKRAVPDLRRDADRWASPQHRAVMRLPITLHMATDAGEPVTQRARVRRWIERANRDLAPFGIQVEVRAVRHLPSGWESVTRWGQRRQLAHYAPRDGTIHVFVIEELDRRRKPILGRKVRGLHWRYRGVNRKLSQREYIMVTSGAPTTTLAHEIGHLFGLRHSTASDNIMCSCRSGSNVRFTYDQGQQMRDGVRAFMARQNVRHGASGVVSADRRRR